jgi:tetratricopeptide (TPR) repeat protein
LTVCISRFLALLSLANIVPRHWDDETEAFNMGQGAHSGDDKLGELRATLAAARARCAASPDEESRGALAKALTGFGDLLRSRGDLDGALAAYREGLSVNDSSAGLAEKIGAVLVMKSAFAAHRTEAERDDAPPGGAAATPQRDAAWNLARAGDLLTTRGDPGNALALYREAIRQRRELAAQHPENAALLEDVAWRLGTLGDALASQGDSEGALVTLREAVEIRRALLARDETKTGALRDLSWSLGKLGDVLARAQDNAGALATYREDVEITRRLQLVEPVSEHVRPYLAITLGKLGDLLAAQLDFAGALAAYRECLALRRELAATQSDNDALRNDACITLGKIGQTLAAIGDFDGALAHHREALVIRRRLAAKHPGNADWESDVAWSEERVAELLEKLQQPPDSAGDEDSRL